MSSEKSQAEIILKQLLSSHFFGRDLEWSYMEGRGLADVDRELYIQILKNFPEIVASK